MSEIPVSDIPLDQLLDEIDREETLLRDTQRRLEEAYRELKRIIEQLEWEKVEGIEERLRRRRERIAQLEKRITERAETIKEREESIAYNERRLPTLTPVDYFITRRVLTALRRSLGAYRRWQNQNIRSLRANRGWETREEDWLTRQRELREQQEKWQEEINILRADLIREDTRLREKRERVKLVQAQIVIVSITTSIKAGRRYEKRFQAFYLIDAIRDPKTGKIIFDAPLTQRELNICFDDFYYRWHWIDQYGDSQLPHDTTPPRLTDTSSFDLITDADGAWFLYCSVIEDDEREATFGKKEQIYEPTDEEKKEIKKFALEGVNRNALS